MNTIDLTPFSISRPLKVEWLLVGDSDQQILEALHSKSLRKFLRHIDEILAQNTITWEYKAITKKEYLEWHAYYSEKMRELKYDIIAKLEWFEEKEKEGKTVEGLFFYQNTALIGSGIIARKEREKASFAYKASDKIELTTLPNGNLGAIIDYMFIKEMKKKGVQKITGGTSLNSFGAEVTLGYLEYKLNFYSVRADEKSEVVQHVPVAEDGSVVFYGKQNGKDFLFGMKKKNSEKVFDTHKYNSDGLPFLEIIYD